MIGIIENRDISIVCEIHGIERIFWIEISFIIAF